MLSTRSFIVANAVPCGRREKPAVAISSVGDAWWRMTIRTATASSQCDIDPGGCVAAWLLLVPSVMVHAARCCAWGGDDEDTDSDGEPCTMYT